MTDITDQDRRLALRWCDMLGDSTLHKEAAATRRVILATVDAPEPTLEEELRHIAEYWEEWATDTITSAIRAAADRAEQVEKERDEARKRATTNLRAVDAVRAQRDEARAELAEAQSELAEVTNAYVSLREDYDHARAEVERLNRERDRLQAQVQGLTRRDGDRNSEVRMLTEERDEAILDRLPTPQIIRTVEELEALDGFVWLMCRDGIPIAAGQLIRAIREYGSRHYLPAVVVLTDTQIHAARKALEEA